MNFKTMTVITGLAVVAGLNIPVSATNANTMTPAMDRASLTLNPAIAQATSPTGDAMKKPTNGAMSNPNPAGSTMKKPTNGAMSNPNPAGSTMKKP